MSGNLTTNQNGICVNHTQTCRNGTFEDIYTSIPGYSVIESCDGIDNNCDGNIDEDLVNVPLLAQNRGVCAGYRKTCMGSIGYVDDYSIVPNYFPYEICDNLDNDCNSSTLETNLAGNFNPIQIVSSFFLFFIYLFIIF